MANYSKLTDFASKDTLPSGNANKIIKGTEIDDEFQAIETAISSKAETSTLTSEVATLTSTLTSSIAATNAAITTAVDNINTLNTWNIEEVSGELVFKVSGVAKAKLDTNGNFTAIADIAAYGTV